MQRFDFALLARSISRFFIDFGRDKACNLHVAQRPLTKGVLFAPSDMDVTGERKSEVGR